MLSINSRLTLEAGLKGLSACKELVQSGKLRAFKITLFTMPAGPGPLEGRSVQHTDGGGIKGVLGANEEL